MQELRVVTFVARHTVELQGLRTALIGGLCLTGASWYVGRAVWTDAAISTEGVGWIPIVLVGWHLDNRLEDYYRARMGHVLPLRPGRRLLGLVTITLMYAALRLFEVRVDSPVAVSALLLAAVQLHIGLISGETYRRHYLLGALCWAGLAVVPILGLSTGALSVFWLTAMGITLIMLGWRDHVVLSRSLTTMGESSDV